MNNFTSFFLCIILGSVISGIFFNELHESELEKIRKESREILEKRNEDVRKLESSLKETVDVANTTIIEKQNEIKTLETKVSGLIKSGAIRMRDPNRVCSTRATKDANTSTTSRDDDSGDSELSGETAQFLWGESSRADRATEKLIACQKYVSDLVEILNNSK